MEQIKKSYQESKHEFDSQNRTLLQELPEFYEQRIEYFQPSVQALIKSQADYYCESERLFSDLVITNPSCSKNLDENEYQEDIEKNLTIIKSLSIVTD